MNELTPELTELAHALGVATDYYDWQGRYTTVPPRTVVAVLDALGIDASTRESAASALADHRDAPWRRMLPACTPRRPADT